MRRVALLGASLLLSMVRAAQGQPSSLQSERSYEVALNWAAPEACPDSRSILARVEALVGRAVTASPNAPFAVEAKANRDGAEAWTLELSFQGAESPTSRTVTAATCDELADAAALFIALAFDPSLPAGGHGASSGTMADSPSKTTPAASASVPPPRPRSAAETRAVSVSKRESAPQPPFRFHFGALGAIWFERLPSVAPGLLLITGVSRYRFCVSAELGFFPEQHAEVPASQTGGDLWLTSAELNLAYALTDNRLTFAPYAGLEFELMHGAGTGQLRPNQGATVFAALSGGVRFDYFVTRAWALQVRAKGSVPFTRPFFHAGDVEVFRPSWWGAEVGLGAVVVF